MIETQIISIDLDSRGYDIYIGEDLIYRLDDALPESVEGLNAFIITDQNAKIYAEKVHGVLKTLNVANTEIFTLKPGERSKSIGVYDELCQWLLNNHVNRQSIIFAVGGGVVGDLAGFTAATILRGIPFVQVPTTLLAQVDSSIGGKTGINTPQGKNLIGAFHQPIGVVTDISTLKTLPKRELLAGYAELVKHALVYDANFFEWLETNGLSACQLDEEKIVYAIEKSCQTKAKVVEADEREGGVRALLNLGHTFGHALEAAAKYDGRLLHGEAVAIGTIMAYDLSVRLGYSQSEDHRRVEEHFLSVGLPTRTSMISPALSVNINDLLGLMTHDKKVKNGRVNFIVPKGIGDAFVTDDVPLDIVREVIQESIGDDSASEQLKEMKEKWKSAFSSL